MTEKKPKLTMNNVRDGNTRGARPNLQMRIDMNVLEHLGLKMYTSLPAVIAEFVANCWDSAATLVDIKIPKEPVDEDYAIMIKDNGIGMTVDEVNRKFLVVGRNRRKEEGTDEIQVKGKTRRVIGRKGLGKLAGFGVAGRVEMRVCKDGKFVEFRMDYDEIQKRLSEEEREDVKTTYKPEVLSWGSTKEVNGTTVKLTSLKRIRPIDISSMRKSLARHFSILGGDFLVRVNGKPLAPAERDLKKDCEYVWEIKDEYVDKEAGLKVNGWIGTMKKTVPPEIERGIVVMARGKLIHEPTTFDVGGKGITGQHGLAYIVGELHAEFLDAEEDLIATGRRSVLWENEYASKLRRWANEKITEICGEWSERRREKREKVIREEPEFKEWLQTLTGPEKKVANKVIKIVTSEEAVSDERRKEIMSYVKTSFDQQAFRELVVTLEENPSAANLLSAFEEWRVIEAREVLRLVKGRLQAIEQFDQMIKTNAREVPELHKFFANFPWILDPSWIEVYDEVHYSDLLRANFPDNSLDEPDRRIDFVCMGVGDTVHVVELKRPSRRINWADLDQLEKYVAFVRGKLGTSPRGRSYRSAAGYIVAEDVVDKDEVRQKIDNLERSRMYVLKYADCLKSARRLHQIFSEKLEEFEKSKKRI
jgi:hypothetical protein